MKTEAGPLRVLLVEDNAGDASLLREMFSKEKAGSFELTHLLRMSEAVVHLAKGAVDVVLLDLGLPDGHGLDTVRRAHAAAPGVPLIVLTGLDDEALAAAAMAEGAQDYLIKGQIESRALPRALRHAIERCRMQAMINDLLEVTRLQAGQLPIEPQSTPVADASGDALNTLQGAADAKGIKLSADFNFALPLPPVSAFSLPDMVESVVRKARRHESPLVFVVAEISAPAGWLSDEARTEHMQGIRDLLSRCLHDDLDVLLPRIGFGGPTELFFIVALTDQIGGEAIVKRIRSRVDRSEYVTRTGLTVSISSQLLDAIEADATHSTDDSVAQMSGQIQGLIDFELTSREAPN
jgi:DNA-binding response OmpR family regulator